MKGESSTSFGVIFGNRDFFPDSLVEEGRKEFLRVLNEEGYRAITLSTAETQYGAVETHEDAEKCARLFRAHRDKIDGIIVTLPNFGDEKAVAETLRLSGLNVPILIHAYPDDLDKLDVQHRRDSFCGKLSLCNNLVQYGIPFTDTSLHVEDPTSDLFRADLARFARICRVVNGLRHVRLGAIGARPTAFNTVRFSEKILERSGISVETIDLSEVIARAQDLDSNAHDVRHELERIESYVPHEGIPQQALEKMARLSVVLNRWIEKNEIDAIAIQCWTAIEELYGIVPCTVMSILSENLIPSACEMDITGALSMYALQLASGSPAGIADWNNNYGDDPNKVITFHCSNFPKSFFTRVKMSYHDIIAGSVGRENTYGTCVGRFSPGPVTFLRLSTDDSHGSMHAYVAEGEYTNDEVETFGGYGVARVPKLQKLLEHIKEHGFEHHVALVKARVGKIFGEAFGKYLGWDIYSHSIEDVARE